ncbi:metalloregulator ArsR/SmtB family transcription factor [Cellulomonas sp. NPDC089187]|uniref:ArsR/SmtB family transcription factor n=1 Tax=Cellulomonas sp. NPDC089187 TaxID=3154970 RepID=UPI00342F17A1
MAITSEHNEVVLAAVFRALAEPARLTILRHLFTGEHAVRELTDHLGLAQSTVSAHLACLRDCGLVTVRSVGRSSRYSLADPMRLAGVLAGTEELVRGPAADTATCALVDQT